LAEISVFCTVVNDLYYNSIFFHLFFANLYHRGSIFTSILTEDLIEQFFLTSIIPQGAIRRKTVHAVEGLYWGPTEIVNLAALGCTGV